MWSLRTIGLSAVGLALVGGLAITAFRTDPIPVDTAPLVRGALSVTVDADGKTRIREVYEVSSPIAGTVLRLPVAVGDPVAKGVTVVAQVQPAVPTLLDARSRAQAVAALHEAEASVKFAEAEVARTEAQRAYAQSQFDRAKALADRGTASLTALETAAQQLQLAEADKLSAEARLAMSRAALESAQAVLAEPEQAPGDGDCCLPILAPADGVVLSVEGESARPVMAGAPLLSIGDPDDLEIVVDLLSSQATRLAPGASVEVGRWGGEGTLAAELRLIEPAARTVVSALGIEEQRVDAVLDFTSPPEMRAGLGQAYAVFVRIEEWRTEDALLIPLSAIFRREGQWFTYVLADGTAHEISIEIGRRDGRSAEVLAGVKAGDRVILHPPDTVGDGVEVVERDWQ
ncbi:HlyD family secretion protein [Mameliella alba]|uniref:efflux RND transporter periplasmic adaptor subunit n=1 Tax=Mameliella alba TaxID=561184 RepID=UPI000888A065|nr:HlyD family efflux transporter periplasmic adaptor subunit [Mameliella alba]OWV48648.1 RND transporter [Mameliella alba]PTR39204.1 HlyD family secretion protein [Mameliella alba]GGF64018.1 secretion protein HlyD [Mameliella alba]SDD26358.1 HlyD family secretion protein [Mameliella alba]